MKVQGILRSLGIVPIKEVSVLKYQAEVRRKAMRRTNDLWSSSRWRWRFVPIEEYRAEIPQFALWKRRER